MLLPATFLLLAQAGVDPRPALDPLRYFADRGAADRLARAGDWSAAVPLYRDLVQATPWDEEVWRLLALGASRLDRPEEAIEAYRRALELGSARGISARLDLARCCASLGRADEAFGWIQQALDARLEDRTRLAGDPDLAALEDDARWGPVIGALPASAATRAAGWRHDLDHLVAEAQRMHADPDRPAFGASFLEAAAELRASIPERSDHELRFAMMHLLAILDDGHTAIYGPDDDSPCDFETRTLPLKFYLFREGLFVVDGQGAAVDHAGSRVVRIGDLTAEEVLARMQPYRGGDNPMTWTWMGPQFYLPRVAMLVRVGAAASGDAVDFTLEDAGGEQRRVTVATGDYDIPRKLRPSPAALGDPPLYLRHVERNFWIESLPDAGALYVQFNQVRDARMESLAAFAGRLRQRLLDEEVHALIVDVRHNNGGNNTLVRPLVRTLIEFENRDRAEPPLRPHRAATPSRRRRTSSTASSAGPTPLFVGEPSSSSPNFVGEETTVLLPYSHLRGSISTHYWQDSDPWDERPWIAPDLPVEPSAEAYFAGEDPALDAVLAFIREG